MRTAPVRNRGGNLCHVELIGEQGRMCIVLVLSLAKKHGSLTQLIHNAAASIALSLGFTMDWQV